MCLPCIMEEITGSSRDGLYVDDAFFIQSGEESTNPAKLIFPEVDPGDYDVKVRFFVELEAELQLEREPNDDDRVRVPNIWETFATSQAELWLGPHYISVSVIDASHEQCGNNITWSPTASPKRENQLQAQRRIAQRGLPLWSVMILPPFFLGHVWLFVLKSSKWNLALPFSSSTISFIYGLNCRCCFRLRCYRRNQHLDQHVIRHHFNHRGSKPRSDTSTDTSINFTWGIPTRTPTKIPGWETLSSQPRAPHQVSQTT